MTNEKTQKKSFLGRMGKELLSDVGKVAKGVGKVLAAPLIGNLSMRVKDRMESGMNVSEKYILGSTIASCVVNPLAYIVAGSQLFSSDPYAGGFIGGVLGLYESVKRGESMLDDKYYPGSVLGKIASLPIEYAMRIADRANGGGRGE